MTRRLTLVFITALCLLLAALPAAAGSCLLILCVPDAPALPPAPPLPPLPTLPPLLPAPEPASSIEKLSISGLEDLLMAKVNSERTSSGLAGLQDQSWARGIARAHSEAMAARGDIWHNPAYMAEGRKAMGATLLGENVGMAGSIAAVHRALMNSPSHKRNILDGQFSNAGMGVAIKGQTVYVTQAFARIPGGAAARPVAVPRSAPKPAAIKSEAAPVNLPPPPVDTIVLAHSDAKPKIHVPAAQNPGIEASSVQTTPVGNLGASGGAVAALIAATGLLLVKLLSARRLIFN